MKKKIFRVVCGVLAAFLLVTIGAVAAANSQEITALLSYDIKVKYDGKEQTLMDANRKRVYPISYKDTTYIPIRAVANLFDVPVDWDEETKTVILGQDKSKAPELHDYEVKNFDKLYSTRYEKKYYKYTTFTVNDLSKFYYFGGDYQSLYDGTVKVAKILDPEGKEVKFSTAKIKDGILERDEKCDKSSYWCLSGLVKTGMYKILITYNGTLNYEFVKFKKFYTDYELK